MTKFLNISTDTTLGGSSPSDETVSSQKAIKSYVDGLKTDWYGTCSTAASTQAKVVSCAGFVLTEGVSIRVKFTNNQSYNGNPTLNVNGTGALSVKAYGTTNAARYYWRAGEVVAFTYDGTNWIMEDGATATTSYFGVTALTTSATSTSDTRAATPASINSLVLNMIEPYPVYSSSSTYAVGDKVRYSFNAWVCNTAITGEGEAWDANHWTKIDDIQTQLNNQQTQISNKQPTLVSGSNIKTINGSSVLGSGNLEITVPSVISSSIELVFTGLTSFLNSSATFENRFLYFPVKSVSFPNFTSGQNNGFKYAFAGINTLESASFASLAYANNQYLFDHAFYQDKSLSSSFSEMFPVLYNIGDYGFYYTFAGCTNIPSVDLSNITSIGERCFDNTFNGCTSITSVTFPNDISNPKTNMFYQTFGGCTNLNNVSIPKALITKNYTNPWASSPMSGSAITGYDMQDITSIGDYGMSQLFSGCSSFQTIDLSNITSIGKNGMSSALIGTAITSFTLPANINIDTFSLSNVCNACTSLQSASFQFSSIPQNGMSAAFSGCSNLTTVTGLNNITSVAASGMSSMFYRCFNLNISEMTGLTTLTGNYAMSGTFQECTSLVTFTFSNLTTANYNYSMQNLFTKCTSLRDVTFTKLNSITANNVMSSCFSNCTALENVYFYGLKTTSFGSYTSQFNSMLSSTGSSVTHTLHFPSNLSSKISTLSGYPTFGGTSGYVTIAFDLPATS